MNGVSRALEYLDMLVTSIFTFVVVLSGQIEGGGIVNSLGVDMSHVLLRVFRELGWLGHSRIIVLVVCKIQSLNNLRLFWC